MKKLISLITILTITFTALVPSFSATTAPKTVTIKQYVSTLLTTLQIPYTDPIQEAVNQKWVSKGHKLVSDVNAPITKEESAQFIYGVLRTKEGVKPDLYYERILNYYVGDSKNIDPSYKRAVYATIMNGFYEPQLISKATKHFNPKNKVTEAEMKVMMIRLLDESKRYDPFQYSEKTGTVNWDKSWGQYEIFSDNIVFPKVSPNKKSMTFENGVPIQNKEQIIQDLINQEHNKYEMTLSDYVLYDEYINTVPGAYMDFLDLEDSRKMQVEEIHNWYVTTCKFMKAFYNSGYKTLSSDDKAIKENMPSDNGCYNMVENHKKILSDNKMVMQSYFVSGEKTFYNFNGNKYIRGRLYFKINSPNATIPFVTSIYSSKDQVRIKSNTWYYADFDVWVVISANDHREKWSWNGNERGVGDFFVISDVYEIVNKK